jgi:hypothetical protein
MKPQRTSLSIASMTVLGCVCVSGCSPAAPATPQQVNTLIGPLSLSGVVVGSQDRQPIPGVRLELFGSGSATMGFHHPLPNASEFFSANSCSGSGRPDRLRYHAGIAYSRPYGNGDPDKDPESYTLLLRAPAAPAEIVYCLAEGG